MIIELEEKDIKLFIKHGFIIVNPIDSEEEIEIKMSEACLQDGRFKIKL